MTWCRSAIFKHDEVCHVGEVFKVTDDKRRTSTLDDRPPDLGGMSLAKVGLAYKSRLLGPEERGKLRFAAQRPRAEGDIERLLTFPLSFFISLSLEAGRAQHGQVERAEPALDDYNQKAGLETWTFLVTR